MVMVRTSLEMGFPEGMAPNRSFVLPLHLLIPTAFSPASPATLQSFLLLRMGTSLLKSSFKEHKQRKEVSQQAKDHATVAPESFLAKFATRWQHGSVLRKSNPRLHLFNKEAISHIKDH